jgi:hypothetical protein
LGGKVAVFAGLQVRTAVVACALGTEFRGIGVPSAILSYTGGRFRTFQLGLAPGGGGRGLVRESPALSHTCHLHLSLAGRSGPFSNQYGILAVKMTGEVAPCIQRTQGQEAKFLPCPDHCAQSRIIPFQIPVALLGNTEAMCPGASACILGGQEPLSPRAVCAQWGRPDGS